MSDVINQHLRKGEKVLWWVAGGSAIKVAVDVSKRLPKAHLKNLTVTLTDERYGLVGHKDSNWRQLEAAGFKLANAVMQPVLNGQKLPATAARYSEMIEKDLRQADYAIALAGMGPDGHIFGIKPKSPAVNTDKLVIGYEGDDFRRLTLTPGAIRQLDEVVIYATGEEKWPQFKKLKVDWPVSQQPAQALKSLKKVIIFSDYKEE